MVKRQKEKLYQSSREHQATAALRAGSGSGTATAASAAAAASASRRLLPFSHCALTLTAYETPVCNAQGIVFENTAILPFLLQHGIDPCTGQPMTFRDLITLHMHQQNMDEADEPSSSSGGGGGQPRWACPILNKPFVQHSKIVAIILPNNNNNNDTTNRHANVYSWQAYQELNVKANHYEDLLSGQAFDKNRDVLILYDPHDDDLNRRRDINTFFHITNARQLLKSKGNNKEDSGIQHGMTATRIMQQLAKNQQEKQQQAAAAQEVSKKRAAAAEAAAADGSNANQEPPDNNKRRKLVLLNPDGLILARDVTGVRYTTTGGAASLTSTGVAVKVDDCDRPATEEEILQAQLLVLKQGQSNIVSDDNGSNSKKKNKKLQHRKGLVRIVTNLGDITVELHCDIAPRTCYNFLGLCRQGGYNGSKFHRLIPHFMIQGGKQAAASKDNNSSGSRSSAAAITEDESYWGNRPFGDEFDDRLKHDAPGILSMANSGPNTNRRQFFFTFQAVPHLNRKHSVFGHVVDDSSLSVLQEMEKINTNTDAKKDHVPLTKIVIQSTIILVDPVQEAIQLEQERLDGIIAARKKQTAAAQQQTTTATIATSKLLQSAEEKDSSNTAAAATTTKANSNSNNDDVGHFLREQLKQRAASAAAKKNKPIKDPVEEPVLPPRTARRPPPPPKTATNFGNFSAW